MKPFSDGSVLAVALAFAALAYAGYLGVEYIDSRILIMTPDRATACARLGDCEAISVGEVIGALQSTQTNAFLAGVQSCGAVAAPEGARHE